MIMEAFLFWVVALLTGLCAIATVVTQNIVRCATWLLFTLAGTSGIFFLLGADLVGSIQLLVYVGGTLVLVVFGVMLTAQGPFVTMRTNSAEWAISVGVGLALFSVLTFGIVSIRYLGPTNLKPGDQFAKDFRQTGRLINDPSVKDQPEKAPYSAVIGQGFIGVPVGPPHVERPGGKTQVVRANYLLPFEIVSVHLLVVLIGAAYLARAKRRKGASI